MCASQNHAGENSLNYIAITKKCYIQKDVRISQHGVEYKKTHKRVHIL